MADSPRSLVRVVVPVYRELTPDEESSLRNNVRVLAAWPFTVLHPRGVTPPACCRELGLETRAVGDEWLGRRNGIAGYNRMMLSEEFYASFPDTSWATGAGGATTAWRRRGFGGRFTICRWSNSICSGGSG